MEFIRRQTFLIASVLLLSVQIIAAPSGGAPGTAVDPPWMRRVQVGSWTVAIIGGLIASFKAIDESRLNRKQRERELEESREAREQRARELRWRQAQIGTELVDKIDNDAQAWAATQMIDWEEREFKIGDVPVIITIDDVIRALRPYRDKCDKKDTFIRESFDALFYRYSSLERALSIDLVTFVDVSTPAEYYIGEMAKRRKTYGDYMKAFGFSTTLRFVDRFESWRSAGETT